METEFSLLASVFYLMNYLEIAQLLHLDKISSLTYTLLSADDKPYRKSF